MSAFWFEKTKHIIPNHLVEVIENPSQLAAYGHFPEYVSQRSMKVQRAKRIDVECVVRGYLSGSAWAEYREKGTIHGQLMPAGMVESQQLPKPIFTPTTKAETGHDQPLSSYALEKMVGAKLAKELEEKSIAVYHFAEKHAYSCGLILADTKMEFGFIGGRLCLIDELLTPDSSRFWDKEGYSPGGPQLSFDKQYLREYLIASDWNREPPAPQIPRHIILKTAKKYHEAYQRLTGKTL